MKITRTRNDTTWLLYWWWQWFIRLMNTTLHLLWRPAYFSWCKRHYGGPTGRTLFLEAQMRRSMKLYNAELERVLDEEPTPFQDHDAF
jgi:hypothetical protein